MLGALIAFKTAEYVWKAKKLNDPNGPHAEVVNSAKTKLAKCRDGVSQCLDGAGSFIDERTGGRYSDNIHSGVGMAKNLIGDTPGAADTPATPDTADTPGTAGASASQAEQDAAPSGASGGAENSARARTEPSADGSRLGGQPSRA